MKKLAVLMPTYNCAQYLKESIDSILNQTYSDFDLYIYDDCSTDHSKEIIENYNDKRVFYSNNNENLGISKTLNKGLDELLPNYEFIARMDADDWAYPERFQKQLDYLEQHTEVILCGTQGHWLKDITKNPISGWEYPTNHHYIKKNLLFAASFGHSSVVFRSAFFQYHKFKYNEIIITCEDWDLWVRIVKLGNVANLSCFLMKYRILENSNHRSPQKNKKHLEERSIIISNYWKTFDINLSVKQVHEFYYSSDSILKQNFQCKLKILIDCFNKLFLNHSKDLESENQKKFSYMLSRKILDFWKRSTVSKYNPVVWFIILSKVKFMNTIRLIKTLIK